MWLGFGLTGLVPAWRREYVTRWALAFPAVVALALALMLAHLVSGGAVFQSPAAVRAITGAVAAALVLRWLLRRRRETGGECGRRRDVVLAGATSLLVAVVWGSPVFRVLPIAAGGDAGLHAGWTEQLLNGERVPTGPLTGDIPNYYPWLYHALLSLVTQLTPGGHAYLGLAPLHVLQVTGIAATLFGLGYLFAGRWCGAAVAVLGSATGGWGFVVAGGAKIVMDPRAEGGAAATRYLGDLLFVRSYNASFMNLAPPYPRDVALSLLVAALFALALATRTGRNLELALAGGLLGLVGLTQTDSFLVGLLVAAVLAATARKGRRLRTAAAVFLPAVALFSLWAVPTSVSYVRLGGFVDTTVKPPVVLPLWAIVAGWGIVAPLALVGAVRARRCVAHPVVRVIAAALAAAGVVLVGSVLVSVVPGDGFETLGRQHRYWPLVCLPLALLAGLGAHWLAVGFGGRFRGAALAATVCILALAVPSPLLASLALPSALPVSGSRTRALEGDPDEALTVLSEYGDGVCSAAVPNPVASFSHTGFRLLQYRWDSRRENAARIRWAEIYDRIPSQRERARDSRLLLSGAATPEQLRTMVRRYDLDVVVVPLESAGGEAFRALMPGRRVENGDKPYVLYGVGSCE